MDTVYMYSIYIIYIYIYNYIYILWVSKYESQISSPQPVLSWPFPAFSSEESYAGAILACVAGKQWSRGCTATGRDQGISPMEMDHAPRWPDGWKPWKSPRKSWDKPSITIENPINHGMFTIYQLVISQPSSSYFWLINYDNINDEIEWNSRTMIPLASGILTCIFNKCQKPPFWIIWQIFIGFNLIWSHEFTMYYYKTTTFLLFTLWYTNSLVWKITIFNFGKSTNYINGPCKQ